MPAKKLLSNKNFSIIFLLGISAGIPLALVLGTLKTFLTEQNFDLAIVGFLSIATIPYSLKFLIAPFVDSLKIPFITKFLGKRKSWILLSQIGVVFFTIALGIAGIQANLGMIIFCALLLAAFSATQDVVIDAYRIEIFSRDDQPLGASFYIFGYRIGLLISGALALFIAEKTSWDLVYLFMSFFIIACAILTLFFANKTIEQSLSTQSFKSWFSNYVIEPFIDFLQHKNWLIILFFIISFKLSDAFAGSIAMPFFLELNFSKTEIAGIVKTFGLFATLFGVFCGSFISKKVGLIKGIFIAIFLQSASNLSYIYLANQGHDLSALYAVIFVENFSGGIGDGLFVAYLSTLCSIRFSATQYALLSSTASLARSFLSSSAGIVAQDFGWQNFFIISTLFIFPTLLFFYFASRK